MQHLALPEEEHSLILLYQTQSVLLEQFETQVRTGIKYLDKAYGLQKADPPT